MTHLSTVFRPEQTHPSVYIAQGAIVLGDVTLCEEVSVWFNAVIRGDTETVYVGPGTNVQDGAILHADPGYPCRLGRNCSVGHGGIVHGATLDDYVLVGMKAVVMNGATVGRNSIVGAGAIIKEGAVIPPNSLVVGLPGRVVRSTAEPEWQIIALTALHYIEASREFAKEHSQ